MLFFESQQKVSLSFAFTARNYQTYKIGIKLIKSINIYH